MKKKRSGWAVTDSWMRSIHLYTGLFLVPWMAIYATSAICLNHNQWIRDYFEITPPEWKKVRQLDFTPGDSFPQVPAEQADAIVEHLGLDGPHQIQGKPNPDQMTILRINGAGHYRIIWRRRQSKLLVEQQQPFSYYRLMHFLHFRGGYAQPYFASLVWGVIVDAVGISLWFWIISGIYIWARRRKRLAGGLCAIAGSLLFVGLVILLCS